MHAGKVRTLTTPMRPSTSAPAPMGATIATSQIWAWLDEVYDPEIPVISVVDLGIVRALRWSKKKKGELLVTITPTYSGCPANDVIAADIERALREHGIEQLRIERQIAPPWTTDWMSARGKERLRAYGIAPPETQSQSSHILAREDATNRVQCPRCRSVHVRKISDFGSTPCKAHYQCGDCLEPFDYFKCI